MARTQNMSDQQLQQLMMMNQQNQNQMNLQDMQDIQNIQEYDSKEQDMRDFANQVENQLQNEQNNDNMVQQIQMQEQLNKNNPSFLEKSKNKLTSSLRNKLPKNLKDPIVVALIFFLLSQPMLCEQVSKRVPQIINNGKLNNVGLLVVSLLAGALFCVNKMVLSEN